MTGRDIINLDVPKNLRKAHLFKAGVRLWTTGRFTVEEAEAYCREMYLNAMGTNLVLLGRAHAESETPAN
jgi:hypothetical protein